MTNMHLPKSFGHFSEAFHHTDPRAWIVLVFEISTLVAIFAAFLSH